MEIPVRFQTYVTSRFGMFIHWGTYAAAARHEWVQHREEITATDYRKYMEWFRADRFKPEEWAHQAAAAGMKYVVITCKHHEGFCLWDTNYTEYKATNSPAARDLLRELVDAFRAEGLRIGFYYSLIDWSHPDFPIDSIHPDRNRPDVEVLNSTRDVRKYQQYMKDQVTELLTQYGEVDVLWCDFSYPNAEHNGLKGKGKEDWDSEGLHKLIRALQPDIILNNRLDLPPEYADFHTPEQVMPMEPVRVNGKPVPWEACHTLSGSWGYHRDESTWKSPEQLLHLLIETVALGGNLLMNVGPTARGTMDARARAALKVYADWMAEHADSIYGCGPADIPAPSGCAFTCKGDRLFLHIFSWPFLHLHLPGLAKHIRYAQFLHDASEVELHRGPFKDPLEVTDPMGDEDLLTLILPVAKPAPLVPVVELAYST